MSVIVDKSNFSLLCMGRKFHLKGFFSGNNACVVFLFQKQEMRRLLTEYPAHFYLDRLQCCSLDHNLDTAKVRFLYFKQKYLSEAFYLKEKLHASHKAVTFISINFKWWWVISIMCFLLRACTNSSKVNFFSVSGC